MKNYLAFIFIALSSSIAYAQSNIIILNPNKYQYDESLFQQYNKENKNPINEEGLKKIHKKIDSACAILSLSKSDKITLRENLVEVTKDKLIGFMDFAGKTIISPKLNSAFKVNDTNFWIVSEGNKWGLINPTSNKLIQIDLKYNSLRTLGSIGYGDGNPNKYIANLNGLNGVVDSLDRIIIPFEYEELDYDTKNYLLAKKGNNYGFIDSLNNTIIPFIYDKCVRFYNNNLTPVKKGKWGVINKKGNFVIKPEYDDMFSSFQNGILRIKKNDKIGFLNEKGKIIIPIIYDEADAYYKEDVLRVKLNNKFAIIGKNRKALCEFKYDAMGKFKNKCTLVQIDKLIGVISNMGTEIIPVEFENIELEDKYIIAYKKNIATYYDYKGKEIGTKTK